MRRTPDRYPTIRLSILSISESGYHTVDGHLVEHGSVFVRVYLYHRLSPFLPYSPLESLASPTMYRHLVSK